MEDRFSIVSPSSSAQQSLSEEQDSKDIEEWRPEEIVLIPQPPDGGVGWMIVAASFFNILIVDGIAYSFGVFLMEFVQYYGESKGKVAWVGSLLSGFYLSVGPLASALTNKFGCRVVTITGSIISCIAMFISTTAPTIDVLMITFGVMGGIGFGLIFLPAVIIVGHHFSTKRALATGIALSGSGMGVFIFAPVCNVLLEIYEWKGTMQILAGLVLTCSVFGAMMRPLKSKPRQKEDSSREHEIAKKEEDGEDKLPSAGPSIHKSASTVSFLNAGSTNDITYNAPSGMDQQDGPQCPRISKGGLSHTAIRKLTLDQFRKGLLPQSKGAVKQTLSNVTLNNERRRNNAALKISSSGYLCPGQQNNYLNAEEVWNQTTREQSSQTHISEDSSTSSSLTRDICDYCRPLYRKDIFYAGSIRNLEEYKQSQGDMRSYIANVTSIPDKTSIPMDITSVLSLNKSIVLVSKPNREFCPCIQLPRSMSDTIYEMLDFSLLQNNVFLLLCISNIISTIGFYVPYFYITDNSIMKGVSHEKAALLLSIIGITNTMGRLFFGWFADRPGVSALLVNNVCLLLTGLSVFCLPFCNSYTTIVIDCILFGLFVAAYICLTSIILVELLDLDKLTNAFGLLCLFRGGAGMLGAPIAGSIYDKTNSYDLPFFFAGGLLVISGVLSFMVYVVARSSNSLQHNPQVVHNDNQDVTRNDQETVV